MADVDVNDIISSLRQEFIEDASDRLTGLNNLLDDAEKGGAFLDEPLTLLKRDVHSLKGQAGVFGFPSIGQLMHALEDYLEMASEISVSLIPDMRKFLDAAADSVDQGEDLNEDAVAKICASVYSQTRPAMASDQEQRDIPVLLVMARGTQRTVVGRELISCGFRVVTASDPFEAIRTATSIHPLLAVVNREMAGISGVELACVFRAIGTLASCKFIVLTSDDPEKVTASGVPADTAVIRKGTEFFSAMTEQLIDWGYFGDLSG